MRARPAPVGNVRNGVVICQPFIFGQAVVQYFEQAAALILVTVDSWLNSFREITKEYILSIIKTAFTNTIEDIFESTLINNKKYCLEEIKNLPFISL